MEKARPNFFDFATGEQSLDAFAAWLLQWANAENAVHDGDLNRCGADFARRLIQTSYPDFDDPIVSVEVGRQWEYIDVWAKVNSRYLVAIEDKTNTVEHSGQLERYRKMVEDFCRQNPEYSPALVYLKTGNEHGQGLRRVEEKGYKPFLRKDFVELLEGCTSENDIFVDFRKRLRALEALSSEWEGKPPKGWSGSDWQGFFQHLEEQQPELWWEWYHVSNPRGGFWSASTGYEQHEFFDDNYPAKLQIEERKLCFKLIADPAFVKMREGDTPASILNSYSAHLLGQAKEKGLTAVRQPEKTRQGKYMTMAVVDCEGWLGDPDKPIDKAKALENIKRYYDFLGEAINES
jgi:hypothetical protein